MAGGDYAAAHTASDQAETVLYRLAVSPGRRALLGMEPRRGRLVRPLLGATRAETRAYCERRGLAWREDESNDDPRFARARVRNGLLAALLEVAPAAEDAVAETARQLREEAEVLDAVAAEALAGLGGGPVVELAALRALPRATARLVLRELAGVPLASARVEEVLRLGEGGGTRGPRPRRGRTRGRGVRDAALRPRRAAARAGAGAAAGARHGALRRLGGARGRRGGGHTWPSTAR